MLPLTLNKMYMLSAHVRTRRGSNNCTSPGLVMSQRDAFSCARHNTVVLLLRLVVHCWSS